MRIAIVFPLGCLLLFGNAQSETLNLTPIADTTIYEDGDGDSANGAGEHLFFGRNMNGDRRRALIRFDLTALPVGAVISSARLQFTVNRTVVAGVATELRPVLVDWGESTSNATGQEGTGTAAVTGDATWTHRRFPDQAWTIPGGDLGDAVAQADVGVLGNYEVADSELTALVQQWATVPESNFGIALLAEAVTDATAKRISSREFAGSGTPPTLIVDFETEGLNGLSVAGLWFDPNSPGEGMLIIQDAQSATLFFFGYSADGTRLWLVSDGFGPPESGVPQTISLLVGANGSFASPAPPEALGPWGQVTVTFSGCDTGTFSFSGVDGEKLLNAVILQRAGSCVSR